MLSAVDELLEKHRESTTDSLIEIGSEFHDVLAVLRIRRHLFEFIKNLNLPPAASIGEKDLSELNIDLLLERSTELPRYLYEANFYSMRVLMAIYEELEEKLNQYDLDREAHNDWTPPENFAYGTDDEQEIWQLHQANKKN